MQRRHLLCGCSSGGQWATRRPSDHGNLMRPGSRTGFCRKPDFWGPPVGGGMTSLPEDTFTLCFVSTCQCHDQVLIGVVFCSLCDLGQICSTLGCPWLVRCSPRRMGTLGGSRQLATTCKMFSSSLLTFVFDFSDYCFNCNYKVKSVNYSYTDIRCQIRSER